ncbi:MAG: selenide, water dikinase SelD [Pirellulaceae bacterium]|nr:selenide, water dikinase SelD [Pirellulaceae bacterium]
MERKLAEHQIVLLGVGHTNSHVLRMWKMAPLANAQLTCVSNFSIVTYSGMLPGVLAGQYDRERMEIDLVRLAAAAKARLITAPVTGLDIGGGRLHLEGRPPLPFDVLSIGIGSRPAAPGIDLENPHLVSIKPMQTFLGRLERAARRLPAEGRAVRVAIVGGGLGGVEVACCLPARLAIWLPKGSCEITLINARQQAAPGVSASTARRIQTTLSRLSVRQMLDSRVADVSGGQLTFASGETESFDLILWATSATAPPLLGELGLPTDDGGFLLTQDTLLVKHPDQPPIFAVGDSGAIAGAELPKAGVYAVRQGPVLWSNIEHLLAGRPPQPYRPQRRFLKLVNTGDGRAIAEYGSFSMRGRSLWKLKDYIDSKFMRMYQDYAPAMNAIEPSRPPEDERSSGGHDGMFCTGCGGKVGGDVLHRVLQRLDLAGNEHVVLGLDAADDVAVVRSTGGRPLAVTVDFFTLPLDDPVLSGRLAALNAVSDVFAAGGAPHTALCSAIIPRGDGEAQEEFLYQLLWGALHEFEKIGVSLVGGHTIEGVDAALGFTVMADAPDELRTKGKLRAGDRLVLTKPLGVGILLAAHMRGECRAAWMDRLLPVLLQSNETPARILADHDTSGVTDVTGFGLIGHLIEMLKGSGLAAQLALSRLPLLDGVSELVAAGWESTMAPANRHVESFVRATADAREHPAYSGLFDPQTSGGLLIGVAESAVDGFVDELLSNGVSANEIGQVIEGDTVYVEIVDEIVDA